jgi:hypothetical protein
MRIGEHTNNHCGELEAFPYALPVYLVWEVGEANIAHEFFADDRGDARILACEDGV